MHRDLESTQRIVTEPQDEAAYVSLVKKESGHDVVQDYKCLARVHSGIYTLLLCSEFCLVPPFRVFGLASFDLFSLIFCLSCPFGFST